MDFTKKITKEAKTTVGDVTLTYSVNYNGNDYDYMQASIAKGDARIGSVYFSKKNISITINGNDTNNVSSTELKAILDAIGKDIVELDAYKEATENV